MEYGIWNGFVMFELRVREGKGERGSADVLESRRVMFESWNRWSNGSWISAGKRGGGGRIC